MIEQENCKCGKPITNTRLKQCYRCIGSKPDNPRIIQTNLAYDGVIRDKTSFWRAK